MIELRTTDKSLVQLAIGKESGSWYVQTTDLHNHTELSEEIQESLNSKDHALAIAQLYIDKYGFKLTRW